MSEFYEVSKNEGYRIGHDIRGWYWTYEEAYDGYNNPAIAGEGPFETRDEALCAAAEDWERNMQSPNYSDVGDRMFSAQNVILDGVTSQDLHN